MIKVERNFFKKICLLGANNYQLVYNENFFLFSLKWKANKFRVADKILNEIIVLVLNIWSNFLKKATNSNQNTFLT